MLCCHADQDVYANFVSDKNSLEDENSGCSMLIGNLKKWVCLRFFVSGLPVHCARWIFRWNSLHAS